MLSVLHSCCTLLWSRINFNIVFCIAFVTREITSSSSENKLPSRISKKLQFSSSKIRLCWASTPQPVNRKENKEICSCTQKAGGEGEHHCEKFAILWRMQTETSENELICEGERNFSFGGIIKTHLHYKRNMITAERGKVKRFSQVVRSWERSKPPHSTAQVIKQFSESTTRCRFLCVYSWSSSSSS